MTENQKVDQSDIELKEDIQEVKEVIINEQVEEEIKDDQKKKRNRGMSNKAQLNQQAQDNKQQKKDKIKNKKSVEKKNKKSLEGISEIKGIDQQEMEEAKKERKRKKKEGEKKEIKQAKSIQQMFKTMTEQDKIDKVKGESQAQTGDEEMKQNDVAVNQSPIKDQNKEMKKKAKKVVEKEQVEEKIDEQVLLWRNRVVEFEAIIQDNIERECNARELKQKCANYEDLENPISKHQQLQLENIQSVLNRKNDNSDENLSISDLEKGHFLRYFAIYIDQSCLNLNNLVQLCLNQLQISVKQTSNIAFPITQAFMNDLITQNSQRKSYGLKSKDAILYENESSEYLWSWELHNTALLPQQILGQRLNYYAQKTLTQQKLVSLQKLIQVIKKSKVDKDLARIQEEYQKYNKSLAKENEMRMKEEEKERIQKEKEMKENQRKELKEKEKLKKEEERVKREEERIKKEEEKVQKEQERLQKIKEKEEQKEKEAKDKIEKQKQIEQERLDKKRKLEEANLNKLIDNQPQVKVQKIADTQSIISFFNKKKKPQEDIICEQDQKMEDIVIQQVEEVIIKQQSKFKSAYNLDTEAHKTQQEFQQFQKKYGQNEQQYYTVSTLMKSFKLFKLFDKYNFIQKRKKNIIIEDSYMKYTGVFDKQSLHLTARNPLKRDETVIDYEMSSEEEWNEQNGEDLENGKHDSEGEDSEEEKMIVEQEQEEQVEGFIVPDDYLSVSEMNLSQSDIQDNDQVQQQLEERKKSLCLKQSTNQGGVLSLSSYVLVYGQSSERKLVNYFEEFKAVCLKQIKFPLRLKDVVEDKQQQILRKDLAFSAAQLLQDKLKELVYMMHGSFESKEKLKDDFHAKFPLCSKLQIEKKMKDLFVKEKRGEDPRARWYATENTIVEQGMEDDQILIEACKDRLKVVKDEINKQKEELIKMKEEKKILKMEQQQIISPIKQQQQQQLLNNTEEEKKFTPPQNENATPDQIHDKNSQEKVVMDNNKLVEQNVVSVKKISAFFRVKTQEEIEQDKILKMQIKVKDISKTIVNCDKKQDSDKKQKKQKVQVKDKNSKNSKQEESGKKSKDKNKKNKVNGISKKSKVKVIEQVEQKQQKQKQKRQNKVKKGVEKVVVDVGQQDENTTMVVVDDLKQQ